MITPEVMAAKGHSRAARLAYGFMRGALLLIAKLYFRLEVVGAERIPSSGGFVFAPVHRSNLDFLVPALTTPRKVRWMAKDSIFKGGPIDVFLITFGAFPVNRSAADRHALRTCEAVIAGGEPVVMFPEGRRREGNRLADLFDGPSFVACRQRVPIVPVGIGGSDRAMPIGSKMIYPRKIIVVVGEPIYPAVASEGRVPRALVTELTDRLRDSVQGLYDDARSRVGA